MLDITAIESIVATQLEYRLKSILLRSYPELNITTEQTDNPSVFPNVYIHEENAKETGNDLENLTLNAMESHMHIVVSTNRTQAECKVVKNAVLDVMKRLRYTLRSSDSVKINNVQKYSLHFKRTFCPGDEL